MPSRPVAAGQVKTPFGTTQDYPPFLSQIRSSGAKATFAFFAGGEAVSFVQQYTQFGLNDSAPLYGVGFLTEGSVLEAQREAGRGAGRTDVAALLDGTGQRGEH